MADEVASEPPVVEAPTPTPDPEPAPTPAEAEVSSPEPQTVQPEPPTAHIPANEPIASEPEPIPTSAPAPQPTAPVSVIAPVINLARDLAIKARAVIQGRKRKKLDKILTLIDTKKNIGNDDVEKMLHVSDATATRYLTQLEKEGKIIQVGKTGKSVRYVRS